MNLDLVPRHYHKINNAGVYIYSWNSSSEPSAPEDTINSRKGRLELSTVSCCIQRDCLRRLRKLTFTPGGKYVLRMPPSILEKTVQDYASWTAFCSSTGQSTLYIPEISIDHGSTGVLRQTQSQEKVNREWDPEAVFLHSGQLSEKNMPMLYNIVQHLNHVQGQVIDMIAAINIFFSTRGATRSGRSRPAKLPLA